MAMILVLEDDTFLGLMLEDALSGEGHEVKLCRTVEEAMAFVDENHVDLVIADIMIHKHGERMREGGITLISHLKQIQDHPAPIIAISGSFNTLNRVAFEGTARTVGASVTMAKPFDVKDLCERVDQQLAKRSPRGRPSEPKAEGLSA